MNSISWKKGMRIAVEVNDDIFLATITKVGKEKLFLAFDDGDTGKVSVGSKRILGIANNTKRKSPVPKAKLDSYLEERIKPKKVLVQRRPVQSKLTEEQLKILKQYDWDVPSITTFLKLPKYRDLVAFYVSSREGLYKDYNDFKESMLDSCMNPANKPDISKLTTTQIKNILNAFQKLGLISIEKSENGFRVKKSGKGHMRFVGLSWAKLYNYNEMSNSRIDSVSDYYNKPGIHRTGD